VSGVSLQVIPVRGIGEITPGDEIAVLVADAAAAQDTPLEHHDCLVITQKIVSKAENRLVPLDPDDPEARARLIEAEAVRIVRRRGDLVIAETTHGFVCANAGIDLSNVDDGYAALLPIDSDRSAHHMRNALRARYGIDVAIIVSDTFGRPWREGHVNFAIGVAGMLPLHDYTGEHDPAGYELRVTSMAIADELAAAAELAHGKLDRVPVAVVRGYEYPRGDGSSRNLLRDAEKDLFR
jgi:coenzyme F420-0:L-glutamate ligase/coenzyme F420-1:gamma-L-glutamate ligase